MRILLSLFLTLALAGCAAGGALQQVSDSPAVIDSSKAGAVLIKSSNPEHLAVAEHARQAIHNQLIFKRVFASVRGNPDGADFILEVLILELKTVTSGERVMLGALAGQARILADVTVIDKNTGSSVGKVRAEGKSSGGNIFAGTTSEALDQLAIQITDYLIRNRKI